MIVLSPYDIIRLRTAANLSTTRLLEQGIVHITRESFKKVFGFGPITDMFELFGVQQNDNVPVAMLSFHSVSEGKAECRFLAPEEGGRRLCGIYENRPTMCRLHPLGCVTIAGRRTWFFRHPLCGVPPHPNPLPQGEGWMRDEARDGAEQTVKEWVLASRLTPFLRANARYLRWMRDLLDRCEVLASLPEHQWQTLATILYDFDSHDSGNPRRDRQGNSRVSVSVIERMFYQWLEGVNRTR
jgi:Fe-S-cluster containining protein